MQCGWTWLVYRLNFWWLTIEMQLNMYALVIKILTHEPYNEKLIVNLFYSKITPFSTSISHSYVTFVISMSTRAWRMHQHVDVYWPIWR